MQKQGIAGTEIDQLWRKQDAFNSLYWAMGLKLVDSSFEENGEDYEGWKDYCTVHAEMQEWTEEESGKTVKAIVEASFKEGKRFGFSREVTAEQVSLKLYGEEEEMLGEIVWDHEFKEISR